MDDFVDMEMRKTSEDFPWDVSNPVFSEWTALSGPYEVSDGTSPTELHNKPQLVVLPWPTFLDKGAIICRYVAMRRELQHVRQKPIQQRWIWQQSKSNPYLVSELSGQEGMQKSFSRAAKFKCLCHTKLPLRCNYKEIA